MMKAAPRQPFGMAVVVVVLAAAFAAPVAAAEFPIATTTEEEDVQSVAFDGTNFLVGIQKNSPSPFTGAKLVDPSGNVLATVSVPVGDPPEIAFGSSNYLLTFAEFHNYPSSTAQGVIVNTDGTFGSPFQVSQTNTLDFVDGVAFDGTNYLVVWTDQRRETDPPAPGDRDIYGRFVSPAGVPQGSDFKISGAAGKLSAIAFAGGQYLVAWSDDVGDAEVHARFVSPAGVLGTEFTVNASPEPSEHMMRVATDGTNFLVIWPDETGGAGTGNWDLFAQRVSPAGALLGGVIPLTTAPGTQLYPFAAFDGTNYLVTWTDFSADANGDLVCDPGEGLCLNIQGRFVSAAGAFVGETMLLTPDAGLQAKSPVGFGAGQYLLGYISATSSFDVFGRFVPVDHITWDGFESGTVLAWSAATIGGGDLATNSAAPLQGSFDLKAVVSDANPLFVEDRTPLDEDHYRARFRFDPADFDPGMAQVHFRTRIFIGFEESPIRRLFAVVLRRQGSQFSLMARAREDSNVQINTPFFNITSAPHVIEVEWRRATTPASADGELSLWIDGTQQTLSALQNNRSSVDFVRMGALSVKSGASGTLFWDDFVSRRSTYIGP
jgi:hypothetical protein